MADGGERFINLAHVQFTAPSAVSSNRHISANETPGCIGYADARRTIAEAIDANAHDSGIFMRRAATGGHGGGSRGSDLMTLVLAPVLLLPCRLIERRSVEPRR